MEAMVEKPARPDLLRWPPPRCPIGAAGLLGTERIWFRVIAVLLLAVANRSVLAATTQKHYFAHDAVEDRYGVIAPWYRGQNGQIDFRVRIAAEFLKRYPWVDTDQSVMAGPHYIFNARVELNDAGVITVLPATDQMNGNLGQRFKYISESLIRYYRYTGDPVVFSHLKIATDFLLDYCQTGPEDPWPRFPISVPCKGRPYGRARSGGYIQLDLAAGIGKGVLRTYQLTGERRYFAAARHWGDLFAEKCNYEPGSRPWGRYANPEAVPWGNRATGNIQTGGVCNILLFLEDLIRLGYTGKQDAILKARRAGRAYLRGTLLPRWYVWDTWGRHYWDWEHPVQGIATTGWAAEYLMDHQRAFPNWTADVRNVLSLYFHHACVSPKSNGDVYSGAWACPEGPSCCGRSLDVCAMFLGRYMARYGVEADSAWAREIARREITLGFYHFHERGKCEDNIDGGQITAKNWSELIGLGPILFGLELLEWLPELGPQRENHVMRTGGVVRSIVYGKGRIAYSTFDAPAGSIDIARLAFQPRSVSADGEVLKLRNTLHEKGYMVQRLPGGDFLVSIRHDGKTSVAITGEDPQEVVDEGGLEYEGPWRVIADRHDFGGKVLVANSRGATVRYRFHGNQVRLIGRADPSGGLADVYLDGTRARTVIDGWIPFAARHQHVLYYRNGLANGPHELRVVVRGERVPASAGKNVYVDAIQSSAAVAAPSFGVGGGPTRAQRMIFGYTRRRPYVDHSGNAWLPATEFVVRTGHHTDPVTKTWWTKPTSEPIRKTEDAELYRYGVHARQFWANITVAPGKYGVRLKFAERRRLTDPKRRPMRVQINGRQVVAALDVASRAGGLHRAMDLFFAPIRPRNGVIEIRFQGHDHGEAMVQAIEVVPAGQHHAGP